MRVPFHTNATEIHIQNMVSAYKTHERIPDMDFATQHDLEAWDLVNLDPNFAHSILYHRKLISGTEWALKARTSGAEDSKMKNIYQEMLEELRDFQKARFSLSEAVFRGLSFAYIRGKRVFRDFAGMGHQHWWVPYKIQHIDKWRVRRYYKNRKIHYEIFSLTDNEWKTVDPRCLIIVQNTDEEAFFGSGNGLLNALWQAFHFKKLIEEEALNYVERFAQGFYSIAIDHTIPSSDGRTPSARLSEYLDLFEDAKARHFFGHDSRDELKLHDASGQGWQVLEFLLNYYDNSARLLSIGANLPVSATDGGSFALGQVQQTSIELNAKYGRALIENAITDHVITLVRDLNKRQFRNIGLGDARHPRFILPEEKNLSPMDWIQIFTGIKDLGGDVTEREIYSNTGVSQPAKGEKTLEAPKEEAQPQFSFEDIQGIEHKLKQRMKSDGLLRGVNGNGSKQNIEEDKLMGAYLIGSVLQNLYKAA